MGKSYEAKIKSATKTLSVKEKIQMKDTSAAIGIDEALSGLTDGQKYIAITLDCMAVLDIHNEKSSNPDYETYVFRAVDGTTYYTSSESAYKAVEDILEELKEAGETEAPEIGFYHKESKNNKGKNFITATLL